MEKFSVSFHPSRQFILAILICLVGSLGILGTLPNHFAIKIFLSIIVLGYSATILWQHGFLRAKTSILALHLSSEGWQLEDREKRVLAELSGDSTLTTFVSILRFTLPNKSKKSFVVFRDSMPPDFYRRLLVKLHYATIDNF